MFNPAKAAENIKNEFVDYILTTHAFANKSLQNQLKEELNETISKGPIIEINDIFKLGKSIRDLINDNVLSKLFLDLEKNKPNQKKYAHKLPVDRQLYLHQEKAVKAIVSGKNVIVSTGTGSGKTNCFLIPILNDLLREVEAGTLGNGVRAMFIYPMNALSNDQMKNIREILMCYPQITFGSYNGATEYGRDEAVAVYESMFANESIPELRKKLKNEILSREEMKASPPNILFTNYAMLEHMLFRPNDDVLFSNADFKFVVLDEAHVYNGATGIETALLMRRLKARISSSRDTQFILTSATLGDNDQDILTFANNLCGVDFNMIVRGEREKFCSSNTVYDVPTELYDKLANEENVVADVLEKFGYEIDKDKDEKELLYDLLLNSKLYNSMRNVINGFCDIYEFSQNLNIKLDTAIAFISLCTRAQKNRKNLLDAKYHYFIKSLEGCYIALCKNNKLFLNRKTIYEVNNEFYTVFEIAICDDCGEIALVGQVNNRKLVQSSKFDDDVEYYYLCDDNTQEDFEELDEEVEKKLEIFYVCSKCGSIVAENELHNPPCDCDSKNFLKVKKARLLKTGARCGSCGGGYYKRLYLGNDAATSVLATSLYEELPEICYEEASETDSYTNNIFIQKAIENKKKIKKTGRQFLVFSDSRQQAAKFACYLDTSYKEFLRRRGICRIIKEKKDEIIASNYSITDFVKILTNYFTTKKSFVKSNTDEDNSNVESNRNAWVAMLNELVRYRTSTSLTSLGQLQFEYKGNSKIVDAVCEKYRVTHDEAKLLLDLLSFEIVKFGAILTDTDVDINDNDRKYIYYSPSQKFVTYLKECNTSNSTVFNWAPKAKKNKGHSYYNSFRMNIVCRILNVNEEEASDFLKMYFEYLKAPSNEYHLEDRMKNGTYAMPAKHFTVKIDGSKNAKWYKCNKCGKITQFNLNGYCTIYKCDGTVSQIEPREIEENNHFAKLYLSDRMSPLFIKEHTAQLSKKESADYQQQFIKKEINALSCSTTFEMGVDVGDLETVFLRNVPPSPSNYAQRAGRAGRSLNAAAFALTFAKLSSHDFSYFNNPEEMISGKILPPVFKIDNEKIVKRHIYAIALAMFFANNPDQYNYNKADKFVNKKGYLELIEWLNTKPKRLHEIICKSIPDIDGLYDRLGINDYSWIDGFCGKEGIFTELINEYESNVENFDKEIERLRHTKLNEASSCKRRKDIYTNKQLIDFLARGNILPKYGFPVDTVELYQNSTAKNISKLSLSRDLQMAIAEYAPSSEVIADGRMYTSRYIKKAIIGKNNYEWHSAFIGNCINPNCKTLNYSIVPIGENGITCFACGEKLRKMDFHESIQPINGFVAERESKDVPMEQQEKNYRSEDYYIGNKSAKTIEKLSFEYNGIQVDIESTTNDSLLVKSLSNFYVCDTCGYAVAQDESIGDENVQKEMQFASQICVGKKHDSLFGLYKCSNTTLRRTTLHHVFNTDVAKLTFHCDNCDYKTILSVMYAILNSISIKMNIERKDIKACLSKKIGQNSHFEYSIIIYDAVPGGAGHSRRLVTKDGHELYNILMDAKNRMYSCSCSPSCYKCLRSYENQKVHDQLDRELAYEFLNQFEGDVAIHQCNA